MKSTITSKGQTTIPKAIREKMRLDEGTEIDWAIADEGSVVVRALGPRRSPFQEALGAFPLPEGETTQSIMLELRGERDPHLDGGPGARIMSLSDFLKRKTEE